MSTTLTKKQTRKRRKGQSLVEYALLLSLVAIAAIAVLGILGMAVTRGYALVAGALGAQHSDASANTCTTDCISLQPVYCDIVTGSLNNPGSVQIVISANTSPSVSASDLTASTPSGFLTTPFSGSGTTYSQSTTFSGTTDPSLCPKTVVVQSKHATAISAVTVMVY